MISRTLAALAALAIVGAAPAFAAIPAATSTNTQSAVAKQDSIVVAKHGADDGAAHDKNDDKGGKRRGRG